MPNSPTRPAGKALIDRVPRSELRRQITPWATGSRNPQYGFDKEAIIDGRTAGISDVARQPCRNALKLIVT